MPPTNSTVSNLDTSPQIPAVHGLLVRSAHPLDDTPEKKRDAASLGPMLYDQESARLVVCTESIPNFDGVSSRVPILEFALKRMVMPGKYPFVAGSCYTIGVRNASNGRYHDFSKPRR